MQSQCSDMTEAGGTWYIQRSRRCEDGTEKLEAAGLEDWSDTAASQGVPAVTSNWKGQVMCHPLGPLEGVLPCWHLGFSPVKLISDFCPLELWEDTFLSWKPQFVMNLLQGPRETNTQARYVETMKDNTDIQSHKNVKIYKAKISQVNEKQWKCEINVCYANEKWRVTSWTLQK